MEIVIEFWWVRTRDDVPKLQGDSSENAVE